jgi:hypothetical protein
VVELRKVKNKKGVQNMLKNISSIIFAVITLVWKKPLYRAIYIAYSLKFGETLAAKAVGNPELSLEWPGKCRDLTGIKSERHLEDKVHAIGKPMDKMSFDSKPYPISGGNNKLPSYGEIHSRKILKFGETLAARAVGNPELSLEWPGKCRDLTGIKSERYLEDKVHTFAKALDKLNWWNIGGWVDRIRGSKKRNGQLSLFRIDMKGAVNA